MIISVIAAVAENNAIGKNNQLLWKLPTDLRHFKNITNGHTVIMGRKTYDSMGKPLPNRKNIIITRDKVLKIEGAMVTNSLHEALKICNPDEEIFIIGGAEIYRQALDLTDKIYLTRIHQNFDADSFFPEIDLNKWKEISLEAHEPDLKNPIAFTFSTFIRHIKS